MLKLVPLGFSTDKLIVRVLFDNEKIQEAFDAAKVTKVNETAAKPVVKTKAEPEPEPEPEPEA